METAHRHFLEKETILKQAAEMTNIGHWQWNVKTGQFQVSANFCRLWGEGMKDRPVSENDFYRHFPTEEAGEFT